jgi:hypothetical protein
MVPAGRPAGTQPPHAGGSKTAICAGRAGSAARPSHSMTRMVLFGMYYDHVVAKERQRTMRESARQQSQVRQLRALTRVSRRAERAERDLAQAHCEAMRLRAELALQTYP